MNVLKCFRCGEDIFFDDDKKSQKGKLIPLDLDTEQPHNCPKSNYKESKSHAQELREIERQDSERSRKILTQFKPKHTISDTVKYLKDKTKLGGLILEGMETTGGTDIDWLVEHNGGFFILENKEFNHDFISIKIGQMIALERLHEKLDCDGKCSLLFLGYDDIDFKKPDSVIYYFDMKEWKDGIIPFEKDTQFKRYKVSRKDMKPITLNDFRQLMEKYWKEFERM